MLSGMDVSAWLAKANTSPGTEPYATSEAQAPGPSRGTLGWLRERAGGWPGPQLAPGTRQEVALVSEKAASGPRGVLFPWFLPYFDEVTGETASIRAAYRRMLSDENVKAALLGKILAVASLDLKIQPADKKNARDRHIADFVKWALTERLRDCVPGLVWSILSGGLVDGYSVCEKVWELEQRGKWAGQVALRELKPKDTGNDVVLQTDAFRNVIGVQGLRYNAGEEFHPSVFLIYRHTPLYGMPVGVSDLRAAYASYWMLDTLKKLRGMGIEKRALPILVGHWKNPSVKQSLEAALIAAKSAQWISAPEECRVEALDIAGRGDDIFHNAIQDCKHGIFLGICGATLQAVEGETTDGRGNSQVHQDREQLFVWHLARAIESILNDRDSGLIRDMVDLNFVVSEYPRAVLSAVDVNELTAEMAIDTGLHTLGVDLSKQELYDRYGRTPPEDESDVLPGGGGAGPGGAPGEGGLPPGFGMDDMGMDPEGQPEEAEEFAEDAQGHEHGNHGRFAPKGNGKAPLGRRARNKLLGKAERSQARIEKKRGERSQEHQRKEGVRREQELSKLADTHAEGVYRAHKKLASLLPRGREAALLHRAVSRAYGHVDRRDPVSERLHGFQETAERASGLAARWAGVPEREELVSGLRHLARQAHRAAKALTAGGATAHSEDEYGHEHGDDGKFAPKGQGGSKKANKEERRAARQAEKKAIALGRRIRNHDLENHIHGQSTVSAKRPEGQEWHDPFRLEVEKKVLDVLSKGGKRDIGLAYRVRHGVTQFEDDNGDIRGWVERRPDGSIEVSDASVALGGASERRKVIRPKDAPNEVLRKIHVGLRLKVPAHLKPGQPGEKEAERFAEKPDHKTATLIAEILYGLYGADALKAFTAEKFAEWDRNLHPRDPKTGRFIKRGSPEAAQAAKQAIGRVLSGQKHGHSPEEVMGHLNNLTVDQLKELHKEHGQKIPGKLRADLVQAVRDRLDAANKPEGRGRTPKAENVKGFRQGDTVLARQHLTHIGPTGKATPFATPGEKLEVQKVTPYGAFQVRNAAGQTLEVNTTEIRKGTGKVEQKPAPEKPKPAENPTAQPAPAAGKEKPAAPSANAPPEPGVHVLGLYGQVAESDVPDQFRSAFKSGMVPVFLLRQKSGLDQQQFNDALMKLDREDKLRLVSIGDRSQATSEQLRNSVQGEGETFFFVEPGPEYQKPASAAGKAAYPEKSPEKSAPSTQKELTTPQKGSKIPVKRDTPKPQEMAMTTTQGKRMTHEDPDGYRVEYENGKITVSVGGRSVSMVPDTILDVPTPYADALRRQGKNPRDYVYVAGSDSPVRRSALPLLEEAYRDVQEGRAQKRQERRSVLSRNVPGLDELRDSRDAWEGYDRALGYMMQDEGNDGARPPSPPRVSADELAAKYPRAALYLRAEEHSLAADDRKASAGKRAMSVLEDGGSEGEAARILENWLSR